MKRPWPLSANSIAMMTCGQGWVLCVPERLVAQASELCMEWSFADIAAQGDALQEEWFARGAKHEERPTLRNAAKYGPLTRLAESLDVRSWSHYFHWYFDPSPSAEIPVDEHVRLIQEDDPPIWEQWLAWGGGETLGAVLEARRRL